jgi:hypothetical protein
VAAQSDNSPGGNSENLFSHTGEGVVVDIVLFLSGFDLFEFLLRKIHSNSFL